VPDVLVQERRATEAAERFFRRLSGHAGGPPERIVTDRLGSCGAAKARPPELALAGHLRVRAAARLNSRVEQSHQPTRRRGYVMRRFKSMASAQRSLAVFSRVRDHFRLRRHPLPAGVHRAVRQAQCMLWRALAAGLAAA